MVNINDIWGAITFGMEQLVDEQLERLSLLKGSDKGRLVCIFLAVSQWSSMVLCLCKEGEVKSGGYFLSRGLLGDGRGLTD